MNARLRRIDGWRRAAVRKAPAVVKGRNGPGLALRERTIGVVADGVIDAVAEDRDPVAIGDELWSILNRMPRAEAGVLVRVYLLGGSIQAEGKMRVHRARELAREVQPWRASVR